jgi:hypothetical protein
MPNERGCGRDADSNTRDVMSGAVIARGQLARSIKLLEGSCSVALRAAAGALRVVSDCGEVRDGTDENFTICPSRQSGQYETMR